MSSKVSPRLPAPRTSSVMPESLPTPRARFPSRVSVSPIQSGTYTWSMNPVWPVPNRCTTSSPNSDSGDHILLIGDTRQHQGVEAGKPFEQLVNAGMKTAQVGQIVRQRNASELRKAVEHLSRGEIAEGVALLEQQGRVTEIADAQQRIEAIAKSYAANPENTIVVSPDNASRRQINHGRYVP